MAEIVIDVLLNNADAAQSIGQMNKSLKDLQSAVANVGEGSEQWNKLVKKAGELKDKVQDAKEQVNAMAGEPLENLAGGFGNVGQKLNSLDFGGVASQVNLMSNSLKSLKLKELSAGIGQVGGAFLNFGKVLLTNPLFLIGAAVAGVVAALYKLKDAGGVITQIFESVGKVFNGFVQSIKNITDAMGLSAFKAKEEMDKMEKSVKSLDEQNKSLIDTYNKLKATNELYSDSQLSKMELLIKQQSEVNAKLSEYDTEIRSIDLYKSGKGASIDAKELNSLNNRKNALAGLRAESKKRLSDLDAEIEKQTKIDGLDVRKKALQLQLNKAEKEFNTQLEFKIYNETELLQLQQALNEGVVSENLYNSEKLKINQRLLTSKELLAKSEKEVIRISTEIINLTASQSEKEKNLSAAKVKYAQIDKGLTDDEIKNQQEKIDWIKKEGDAFNEMIQKKRDGYKANKDAADMAQKDAENAVKEQEEETKRQNQQIKSSAQDLLGVYSELNDMRLDNEMRNIELRSRARIDALETDKMTEEEYNNAVIAIRNQQIEEENKSLKTQFEINKAFRIANSIIAGSEAVISALTIAPPLGEAFAVARAVTTAAQVALIASQKFVPNQTQNTVSESSFKPASVNQFAPTNSSIFGNRTTNDSITPFQSIGSERTRVYVVENDITQKQRLANKRKAQTTL